jgi:hypothetical protein
VAGTAIDELWMAGMLGISIAASSSVEDGERHLAAHPSTMRPFARMALPAAVALLTALLIVVAENRVTEQIVIRSAALISIVLALRTALALYSNWRQGEIEARRARQFESLYEVGLAAAGERSVEELLKLVVDQATGLTRTDGSMLALADAEGKMIIRALY